MSLQKNEKETFRILLISVNNLWRYSNVGVDQIAGYLRNKGFCVDLLYHHKNLHYDEIIESLGLDYDFYGFSINSSNYSCCKLLVKYLRKQTSNATIIFGGGYPTRYYQEIFDDIPDINYIVLGDGELPMENIINHTLHNEEIIFENNIVSLGNYDNKIPFCNDSINYFPAMDYYEKDSYAKNQRKEYCIQTKNNICTGKCTFCTERKGNIVYKSISHIVKEIDIVHCKFGIKKFFFTDDNILDPNNDIAKKRIDELCDAIQSLGHNLVFKCYIKANSLHDTKEDNELLKKMSDTGFKTIFVGIESGNNMDLKLYNKMTTVEENYTIIQLLRKYEIAPQIGFINLNPYSTLESIKQNYYFLVGIEMDNLFMYVCSYMRVYKYTAMYGKIKKDGLDIAGEDYLDDKSLYKFADSKVQRTFDFINKYMLPRVRKLDYEFDWLYSFFLETKKINPNADIYSNEFSELKEIQLRKIKEFFYVLFVENDLIESQKSVEEFLCFFEQLQPRFAQLHRNLIQLYFAV